MQDQEKAKDPNPNVLRGVNSCGTSAGYVNGLNRRLWERKHSLQQQLDEVDDALKTLNEDPVVQKVLRVLEVAGK